MYGGRIGRVLAALRPAVPDPPSWRIATARAMGESVRAELDLLYPGAEFVRLDSATALHALASGEVDAAVFRGPLPRAPESTAVRELRESPLGVLLSRRHRLAHRAVLDWPDLRGERILWFDERRAPGYARWLRGEFAAAGWAPVFEVRDAVDEADFDATLCAEPGLLSIVARRESPDDRLVWVPLAHPLVETLLLAERRRGSALRVRPIDPSCAAETA